jgi:hypothetical protein
MLSEDEIRRIKELRVDPKLRHWFDRLLEERLRLVSVVQSLARQVHYLRQRMKQAAEYLDTLAQRAEETAKAPWHRQAPCPRCGAPLERLTVAYSPERGHARLHRHADGTVCEDRVSRERAYRAGESDVDRNS